MNAGDRDQALALLVELCRELARRGVRVGMSDARPAVSVRAGLTDRKVWVEIDASGASFVWRRDDRERHAVDDPAGAAERIAEYATSRDTEHGHRT